MGYCAGNDRPGFAGGAFGFGGRGGRGGGRGWRNWFRATGQPGWMRFGYGAPDAGVVSEGTEQRLLEEQLSELKEQMLRIEDRLAALGKASDRTK